MPSACNLVAGLCLALVAFIVSGFVPPLLPEGKDMGYFTHINVALGFVVGWSTIGSRMGRDWTSAITVGITGAVVLLFWALFVQSCNEMTRLAMRNRYDGAFEAVVAIFTIGTGWLFMVATPAIMGTLAVGGIVSGLLGEMAARRWR